MASQSSRHTLDPIKPTRSHDRPNQSHPLRRPPSTACSQSRASAWSSCSAASSADCRLRAMAARCLESLSLPGVGSRPAHCFATPGPARFAGRSACSNASVLPGTPSGLGRRRAADSGCEQHGQVSPIAHNTVTDTTDRQTGQRTWARSIGLSSRGLVRRADPGPLHPDRAHHLKATPTPPRRARQTPRRIYRVCPGRSIPLVTVRQGSTLRLPVRGVFPARPQSSVQVCPS
jgi:hypothetical protein